MAEPKPARARAAERAVPISRSTTSGAGKDTAAGALPPVEASLSFELSLNDARVMCRALATALEAADEVTVAIAEPGLRAAIEAAQRAIAAVAPEQAAELRAALEPVERDAARLIGRVTAEAESADRLSAIAITEIDGDGSYKVLVKVVVKAKQGDSLPAVARTLRARPHEIHGNYLDALVRTVRIHGSAGMRDWVTAELSRIGIEQPLSEQVAQMTPVERMTKAAQLGVPEIADEVVHQLVGAILTLPVTVGIAALVAAGYLAPAAAAVLMVPGGLALADDFTAYRDLSLEARTMSDLRAAGSYFAKIAGTLGITAMLWFAAKVRARNRAPVKTTTKTSEPASAEPAVNPEPAAPQKPPLDPTRGAGKTFQGFTRDGWGYDVTMGGANETLASRVKITIPNVQLAARSSTKLAAAMRALLRRLGLFKKGQDAGHAIAAMIAKCEEVFNYFSEDPRFNRVTKLRIEKAMRAEIDRCKAEGIPVTLETELIFKHEPGVPEVIEQHFRLVPTGSGTPVFEPPPAK